MYVMFTWLIKEQQQNTIQLVVRLPFDYSNRKIWYWFQPYSAIVFAAKQNYIIVSVAVYIAHALNLIHLFFCKLKQLNIIQNCLPLFGQPIALSMIHVSTNDVQTHEGAQ